MRRWSDLPPDLLRDISGRLYDAADFVRFHAVCRPWRDSHSRDNVPTMSRTNQFPPWLLAPNEKDNEFIRIRCVFSERSYRGPSSAHQRNWVANADGTAVRYFTAAPWSGLHDPLTGGHTLPLPAFPDRSFRWEQEENPSGIVYGDGMVLLFSKSSILFRAALRRPGDASWTLVERNLVVIVYGEYFAVYHGGKIIVTAESSNLRVNPANNVVEDQAVLLLPMPLMPDHHIYLKSYALETRGELLWVSVLFDMDWKERRRTHELVAFVYALEEVTEGPEKLQWVRKDGRSLADRVLFLGWPNSFAVDASGRLGSDGGCAYFTYKHVWNTRRIGVYRCNLVDMEVELVEWLPEGFHDERCMWLVPQPSITPIPIH